MKPSYGILLAVGVKLEFNKVLLVSLGVVTAALLSALAMGWYQQTRRSVLTLAAGSSTGESYIIGSALKTVVERTYPRVRIALLETGGSVENLKLLEQGRAQMAVSQADVAPGPSARLVAVLYDDTLQLLVHQDAAIHTFSDLQSKIIALPTAGGQLQSFLRVADHFGLQESDFHFVGGNDSAAGAAFTSGKADAIFRVRALGNPSIQKLVAAGGVRFLPIEHAAAMQIKYPAFQPSLIPQGAFRGNPPIPPQDLPAVSVHRLLLAQANADPDAIRSVTQVLMDRRQEIIEQIPASFAEVRLLLYHVRRPEMQADLTPALHPGATAFYDKDKPSFLVAHADYVALILTVVLMIGSWLLELKRWMERQQKNNADQYSKRVVALMEEAQAAASPSTLDHIRTELLEMLTSAVRDLEADKLSEESFHSFRSILQIALEVTRESRLFVGADTPANVRSQGS